MSVLLVPDRECGPCNVCCRLHAIIDPAFNKSPGILCTNWKAEVGCLIYSERPESCRGHFCAWRQLEQFDDSWRPDISNVYIELKGDPPEHFHHELPNALFAFRFTLLGELTTPRMGQLASVIASLINSDVPVILAVAAPPEHFGCHMLLNPGLKPHAAAFGREFMEGIARALRTLLDTPPKPVVFDRVRREYDPAIQSRRS